MFKMRSLTERLVKNLFHSLGFEITRSTAPNRRFAPFEKDKFKWVQNMSIRTIIDVGAYDGRSAVQFHKLFPNAKIYSFEPLHDCFVQLNATMKNVPNFKSFNLALGDTEGRLKMHRSSFAQSSSLLGMGKLHKQAFPFSAGELLETVDVTTLDRITQKLDLEQNILLKLDVQGYEDSVIIGSQTTLSLVKIIVIETSFCELYEGQTLFSDIYDLLCKQGFVYSGSWGPELKSPLDGAPLQQDSIFIKK